MIQTSFQDTMNEFQAFIDKKDVLSAENFLLKNLYDGRSYFIAALFYKDLGRIEDALIFLSNKNIKLLDNSIPLYEPFLVLLLEEFNNIDVIKIINKIFSSKLTSLEFKVSLYIELVRRNFIGSITIKQEILHNIFCCLSDICNKQIPLKIKYNKKSDYDAIILCKQFLTQNHGPTLTALTIAENLKSRGKNPFILNTDTYLSVNKNFFNDNFTPNSLKIFSKSNNYYLKNKEISYTINNNNNTTINYKEFRYNYKQLESDFLEKFEEFNLIINTLLNKKTIIISIGDSNIFSEYLAQGKTVYTIPCSFNFPIVNYSKSIICRKIKESEINLASNYRHPLVESKFPYAVRFKKVKKFEHSDIRFVIVGSRLEHEVDILLIKRMAIIYKTFKNTTFHFVGIERCDDIVEKLYLAGVDKNDVVFHGFIENIENILAKSNFYLNPIRHGGGTSSLEALYQHVYPISFKFGDVYHTVGDFFSFDNDQNVIKFIKEVQLDSSKADAECDRIYKLNTNVDVIMKQLTHGEII